MSPAKCYPQTMDLPIGFAVDGWTPRPLPPRTPMPGRTCRVEPVDVSRHAAELWNAVSEDPAGRNWTYLSSEMPKSAGDYAAWLARMSAGGDPMFHAIVDARTNKAAGVAAYLRIDATNGVIEVGHINYSPRLQRTVAATEAMYLMMKRVFDELGYRRSDSAWFSITDSEWPAVKAELERWLDPANFDGAGRQRSRLGRSAASPR